MKNILTILIVLSCSLANAQFYEGTIILNDSTEIKGLVKIKTLGGVKFKSTEDADPIDYNHKQIIGFNRYGKKYRYVKIQDESLPKLLRESLQGKVSLYFNQVKIVGSTSPPGSISGPGVLYDGGVKTIYFILINDKLIRVGTKMKKKHLDLLKNCTGLMEKMKNKDYRKNDVYKIIRYYNNQCD